MRHVKMKVPLAGVGGQTNRTRPQVSYPIQVLAAVIAGLILSLAVIKWLFGRLVFEVIPYNMLRDEWHGRGPPPLGYVRGEAVELDSVGAISINAVGVTLRVSG
jgi:hypothetical protein